MLQVKQALENLKAVDAELEPYFSDIQMHLERYNLQREKLCGKKSLLNVANAHLYFGFHRTKTGWVFREWLPGADAAWLFGDFNGWDKYSHPLTNIGGGVWEIQFKGKDALKHGQYVKYSWSGNTGGLARGRQRPDAVQRHAPVLLAGAEGVPAD